LVEIANGRKPIEAAKPVVYPFQTVFPPSIPERKASVKERDELNALIRQSLIFRGGYMNVQSLESENDPLVGKFDPKLLDTLAYLF